MLYGVRALYIYIYILFPVNAARSTPRLQSRRVATLCIGAAFALYNDAMAARMATLKRRKIVSLGATALRRENFLFFSLLISYLVYCILFFNTYFKRKTIFEQLFPSRCDPVLFLQRKNIIIIIIIIIIGDE